MQVMTTRYRDLERWDPKSFLVNAIAWHDSSGLVSIGDFVEQRKEIVDAEQIPPMLSIHFGGRVSEREKKEIKGNLFLAYSKDIVFSKIDARNGALCLIPEKYTKAAFTSEFPIYRIKKKWREKIDLRYLELVLLSSVFLETLNSLVSGASGRKRITPTQFEYIKIPIPPLETQKQIVEEFYAAKKRVEDLQNEAKAEEACIDDFLMEELDIEKQEQKKQKGAFVMRYKDLERWGTNFNLWTKEAQSRKY